MNNLQTWNTSQPKLLNAIVYQIARLTEEKRRARDENEKAIIQYAIADLQIDLQLEKNKVK